ncbi:hypothetical protein Tco_1509173 [Tanacetum coccineum]
MCYPLGTTSVFTLTKSNIDEKLNFIEERLRLWTAKVKRLSKVAFPFLKVPLNSKKSTAAAKGRFGASLGVRIGLSIIQSRARPPISSSNLLCVMLTLAKVLIRNGRDIKKVNKKVYAAQVRCKQCKGPHYTNDCLLKEEGKTLEEAYYTQFSEPFQGGGYKAAAPGFYQRNNTNPSYQERRQSMEDTPSKFMSESAKRHKENSNLIKEIRASTDDAVRNQGASIKTLEIQIGQMSKVLQERGFGSLPSSTEANPRDQVNSISTTIEADSYPISCIGSSQYAVSTRQSRTLMYETRQMTILFPSHLNGYYCEEKKGSYGP